MLACKRRYFFNIEDYDDFALYCTSRLYNRFTDKEKSKLKSSLNFIKNTLFFLKVDYQRLMFPVNYEYEFEKRKFNTDLYNQTYCDNLRHNYYLEDLDFFIDNFKLIFQIVKNIINESGSPSRSAAYSRKSNSYSARFPPSGGTGSSTLSAKTPSDAETEALPPYFSAV